MTASEKSGPLPPPLPQQNGLPTTIPQMPPTPIKSHFKGDTDDPNRLMAKKLLPLAGFFVAFATVMTVLLLYIDNTAMKHHEFTITLSKDMELNGIAQDDPQLIMYLREVQLSPAIETHHKPLEPQDNLFSDTEYVMKLLKNKKNGIFIEAGAYSDGKTSKTEAFERNFNWKGLLVQPDPRHFFNLRRHNRVKSQCIHACLSPMPYPREVTLHNENDVKINDIHSNSIDNPDWLVIRVKCFPLFSLLLAMNATTLDYLSLETGGSELQVLETIPFDRVKIEVISVDLKENDSEISTIKRFLAIENYKFMERFNTTYVFMRNRVKI